MKEEQRSVSALFGVLSVIPGGEEREQKLYADSQDTHQTVIMTATKFNVMHNVSLSNLSHSQRNQYINVAISSFQPSLLRLIASLSLWCGTIFMLSHSSLLCPTFIIRTLIANLLLSTISQATFNVFHENIPRSFRLKIPHFVPFFTFDKTEVGSPSILTEHLTCLQMQQISQELIMDKEMALFGLIMSDVI